jgi:hypothetical protein
MEGFWVGIRKNVIRHPDGIGKLFPGARVRKQIRTAADAYCSVAVRLRNRQHGRPGFRVPESRGLA